MLAHLSFLEVDLAFRRNEGWKKKKRNMITGRNMKKICTADQCQFEGPTGEMNNHIKMSSKTLDTHY